MSKQVPKVGDLVEVYWWDHAGNDKWMDVGKVSTDVNLIECRTVGWLRRLTDLCIEMYGTATDSKDVSQQMAIVRSCVTRLRVLERAKQAAPKWTKVKG